VNQPLAASARSTRRSRQQARAAGDRERHGDGFKYGENGALTASSDFTAKVPNLEMADASVNATTHATFVRSPSEHQRARREDDVSAKQLSSTRGQAAAAVTDSRGSVLLHPSIKRFMCATWISRTGVHWQTRRIPRRRSATRSGRRVPRSASALRRLRAPERQAEQEVEGGGRAPEKNNDAVS